jgi:hypothetical protein
MSETTYNMKKAVFGLTLLLSAFFSAGCALSPEDKVAREQALKQTVETFTESVVQSKWNDIYAMSDGSFDGAEKLKTHLTQTWVSDATLTTGQIASMAWINDGLAKVKLNWTFQSGSVQSFSSETFSWIWKGNGWKYQGRVLR